MLTFKINSDQPYYLDGRLVKKVNTQRKISLSTTECAIVGWTGVRLLAKLTRLLLFRHNPYRLP